MRVVVTGANGFIGRHLCLRLEERGYGAPVCLTRKSKSEDWNAAVDSADIVFHLAGENRPPATEDFSVGNALLTSRLCELLAGAGRQAALVLTSSTQAGNGSPYGNSKRAAESAAEEYAHNTGARVAILRLPNVFGKWARPNYNSAIATFCHNICRGQPVVVHDTAASLQLVHVDDVVNQLLAQLPPSTQSGFVPVSGVVQTSIREVVNLLEGFATGRLDNTIEGVGTGFIRSLYSTFVSYLPPEQFSYPITSHDDARGRFAEFIRTRDAGQVSYFTARPGVTRGGHYHHTKTEKFLVVCGIARFSFRSIKTGEQYSLTVSERPSRVVETVPGWAHEITNVGADDLIVVLWANEVFDSARPDTYASKVTE